MAAQFVSAVADNALLIVLIALLAEQQRAPWLAPLLKFGFTLAYVLLAPWVGAWADAGPKGRWMAWMTAVKALGVALIVLGVQPLAGFALVGLGAAAYAPAKYGLVTELVPPARLVAANGWIEVSVVLAAIGGAVAGGVLVHPAWLALPPVVEAAAAAARSGWLLHSALVPSLAAVLLLHGAAAALNLGVPASGARHARGAAHVRARLADFRDAQRRLWRDEAGALSMAVTTLFWGLGATLQFVVLRWAVERLGLTLSAAAALQSAVAVGVVIGALAAARWVPLAAARRVLPCGVALGVLVAALVWVVELRWAVALLVVLGAAAGLLVVPMNALLQHRGHELMSAGRSIAVQGFNENASVLAMLAAYAALVRADVPLEALVSVWGLGVALAMAGLTLRARAGHRGARRQAVTLPPDTAPPPRFPRPASRP